MHGPQSWKIGIVCLIWLQKCMDLAHFIRLELELLRHRSFVTEWRSWLLCIMAILQYWENRWRSSPKEQAVPTQMADLALWSQLFLDKMKKECPGWNTTCRQKWSLFLLEWMFHNAAAMQHKEHQRCSQGLPLEPTKTALEHPSVWTLVGSRDSNPLQVVEQIYEGKYMVAPCMFNHAQQEDFMKELPRDLSRCMTRAGLQS